MKVVIVGLVFVLFVISCSTTKPPKPFGPVPSPRQLAWHKLEFYAFVHFTTNTFSDVEWGDGTASPAVFNPTELDCRQWARVANEAGMKGIILTAKHHDGFCLWPSQYTDYSVKNSPWQNGNGDVVRELAQACKEYDLKMGIYLSPWDRHEPSYGDSPRYNEFYKNQLTELLTNYGELFEVWFDGACGEGPNGKKQEYDWQGYWKLIRELQPNAVIFSDGGPDVRWVGNEEGRANRTNWSLLRRDEAYPGWPRYQELRSGHENGSHWLPAECDVSIRPGWFYHPAQDDKVKSLEQLLDIYYHSVGRNSSLLLNLPVDRRGLVHENDARQLQKLAAAIKADFATNLALDKKISATNVRGNDPEFRAENTVDGNKNTYWATDDDVTSASLTLDFGLPTEFNRIMIQEHIAPGQRVQEFTIAAQIDDQWRTIAEETTIGYKRILRIPNITANKVRLDIVKSKACPVISNFGLFKGSDSGGGIE